MIKYLLLLLCERSLQLRAEMKRIHFVWSQTLCSLYRGLHFICLSALLSVVLSEYYSHDIILLTGS